MFEFVQLFAASSLRQVQYYGFTSVRFYANAQAVNVKELGIYGNKYSACKSF